MVPPNNLGPDLNGKSVNETQYRANPKESHLIAIKRIFGYLEGKALQYQLADIFTKPLDEPTFKRLVVELGGIFEEVGVTTFRNGIGANNLSHSNEPMAFKAPITCSKGTDPHVLVDKTKSASEGLDTIHIKPATGKGPIYIEKEIAFFEDEFNTSPDLSIFDDTKTKIKLEDLSKLVLNLEVNFMDLDSPKNDQPIIVEDEEYEEVHTDKDQAKKVHTKDPKETDDALASQPPSPKTVKIQEPSTRLLLLQTLNSSGEANLTELLVKSIKHELSKLLTSRDFSNSLPTELKELPSKFTNLTREVKELKKYVEKLEVKLPGDLKEILSKLEKFTSTVLKLASKKTKDHGVPSASQAGTHPAEGEKNTQ
ncbi:hypothetical protein Tco_0910783 [Tanacetum coccineum]|uniref:Uncharacterized protein n=1 Tax=Tanacetum coccineum TaxID=301880 RepID=A0ABQ5CX24_9ASTR